MIWVLLFFIFVLGWMLFDVGRDAWKLAQKTFDLEYENRVLREQVCDLELEARADAQVLDDFFDYLKAANRRRKRIERVLRRQQRRANEFSRQSQLLRQEVRGLQAEMQKLEDWKRSTSEYLTSRLLKAEDDEKVRSGLTRKIR